MAADVSRYSFADLRAGQEARFEATVTEADIERFAALSGNVSPLHIDAALAAARGFAGRLVHGARLSALASRLVGVHLPGENILLQSLSMQYRQPVPAGTRLTAVGVVDQLSDAERTAMIKLTILDAATGRTVASGKASVGFTGLPAHG